MTNQDPQSEETLITRYLLHDLPPEAQEEFEAQYFADDDLYRRLALVRGELTDAYVRNHLQAEARQKFERYFLASPEGRQEVAFARTLRQEINELGREAAATPVPPQTARWFDGWTVWKWGWAAAALLLLMGAGWLWQENRNLQRELSALHAERENQLAREKKLQQDLTQLPSPSPTLTATPLTALEPQPTDFLAINLTPDADRSMAEATPVTIPARERALRLRLLLTFKPMALRCRVKLQTPDGNFFERRNLRARPSSEGFVLQADFPEVLLKAGNYEVAMTGRDADDNQEKTLPYRFRVQTASRR